MAVEMTFADLTAFLRAAEERGLVLEAELERLAFELDLDEDELAGVRAELAAREVDVSPGETEDGAVRTPLSTGRRLAPVRRRTR